MPTYFTEIEVGAPANADTFNDPLNELDVAIAARAAAGAAEAVARGAADDNLDDRIDAIVATTGDDIGEVVDARGSGNVASAAATLAERLEWLEGATTIYAAAYGFDDGNSAATNLTALNAACDAAVALALPTVVMLPAGRFSLNNFTLDAEVVLRGARMPVFDRSGGTLEGGTILAGGVITLSDRSGLMDLGVEISGNANAITGGGSDDCIIINVSTRGDTGATPYGHGCVFSAGARNMVCNFHPNYHIHGLILKGSHNTVINVNTWHCGTIVGLYGDGGQDCNYNNIVGVKGDGTASGDGGAIWLNAFSGNSVNSNTISGINIHNGSYGVVLKYTTIGGYNVKYNVIGPGTVDTVANAGVTIIEAAESSPAAGNGCDYNIITGLVIKDATTYSFASNGAPTAVANIITGCLSYSPGTGHCVGVFAQYGINQQSGLMAKVTKSDQAIGTGTTTWVDVTWGAQGGPFSIWNPDGDNTAEVGGVPYNGGVYRLFAYIQFAANATGNRYVQLVRDTGGGYSATPLAVTVRASIVSVAQGITLEYTAGMNSGYNFKVQVKQDSGGNLNVEDASYIIVQALK